MEISIFLAQLLGLYLVIIGLAYFFRQEFIREVLIDFYRSPALIAITSVINLIIGLLIILNHNIWEFSWKIIITFVGYLSLIKGLINLYIPNIGKKLSEMVVQNDIFVYSGVISLALGVYLLYHGFYSFWQSLLAL